MVQRILERGEIEALDHTSLPRLRLPELGGVFAPRAARLRELAAGKVAGIPVNPELSGYLLLMADMVSAQAETLATLNTSDAGLPDAATMERAQQHAMPPLAAFAPRGPAWRGILTTLLDKLDSVAARQIEISIVIAALRTMPVEELEALADAVIAQRIDGLNAAQAPFIAAALQVLWTYQASHLQQRQVPVLETGTLCPVCGSHPVASVIRIGGQSQGYRYLQCSLCSSEWHMVRVKCSCCEQNGKISYQGLGYLDAADDTAKGAAAPGNKANDPGKFARAETCDDCHGYRKIFNQEHDYNVEPLADDLASLTLDVLVCEAGYLRASVNPLLWLGNLA
ncbi:formate dehydrogenase accessory protein FdhE [Undibacterium terreum]|uniref:Protein FdhE homolog n=1 Tax=Undibacterium terreum TaxID=1224302 RepID=A0A916ULK6_9BURK|nr:formate dehydrogenase accessory protein FdhE [Undibacterium terreum]GGC78173.1 protein FdhE [Undibacterium terreum]